MLYKQSDKLSYDTCKKNPKYVLHYSTLKQKLQLLFASLKRPINYSAYSRVAEINKQIKASKENRTG
jgi:hypothetical protein